MKKVNLLIAMIMAVSLCLVPVVAQASVVTPVDPPPAKGYDSVLVLDNKVPSGDAVWPVINNDGTYGILSYNKSAAEFECSFEALGLESLTEYALIYYADKPDRFVDWGGDNPGALIALFTTESDGSILATTVSTDLSMNLPSIDDANISEYDYSKSIEDGGTGDMYANAHGAKIWLVPADCWEDGAEDKVTVWAPTRFLFETDLITYNDTDVPVVGLNAEYEEIIGISADPVFIHFGDINPGGNVDGPDIVVENIGTVTVDVDADLDPLTGTVFNRLMLNGGFSPAYSGSWVDVITSLDPSVGKSLSTSLDVPSTYSAQGTEYATLVFTAKAK